MSNPTGKNQYSGGRGGGRKPKTKAGKGESLDAAAKRIAGKTASSPNFGLHGGATSASHEAFVRQRLAANAAKAKARKKKRR